MVRWIIGLLLIAGGLSALFEVNLLRFIVPAFLIWIGWKMISKDKSGERTGEEKEVDVDSLNEVYIFSGTRKVVKSPDFTGGKVVAIFGGVEIDLTNVKTKSKTINMQMEAVMGGVRVRVPKNWEVDSVGMSAVLGGFDNRTNSDVKKEIKLLISGAAVLGGIEVYL